VTIDGKIASRHFTRRRARENAHRLAHHDPLHMYAVEPAHRGPFRWYVRRRDLTGA
jgi:hypothetical protein